VEEPDFRHVAVADKSVRNEMRKIGYARVSAPHQNLDRQIAALRAQHCHQIFREKASGKDIKNRPQLEKAIDALGTGDVLVLPEWDWATSSMLDWWSATRPLVNASHHRQLMQSAWVLNPADASPRGVTPISNPSEREDGNAWATRPPNGVAGRPISVAGQSGQAPRLLRTLTEPVVSVTWLAYRACLEAEAAKAWQRAKDHFGD
jgi:hypothetical protein